MKRIIILVKSTVLAALLFFTTSFLCVLFQLAPFHYLEPEEKCSLEIGFPFKYYQQFFIDGDLHFGWLTGALFLDVAVTWCFIFLLYLAIIKFKKKRNN